jgi:flagellin-like hook-associated protein FlgL
LQSRSATNPQGPQRNTRCDKSSSALTEPQQEQVLLEGNHRSATQRAGRDRDRAGKLSSASSQIESAKSRQSDYQSNPQTLASNLTGVDVAAVTAQLSADQAQLSPSYTAFAKIESLNLASYLK